MDISWGILGAGRIADAQMAPAMAATPGHRLVAVMARDAERARAFAEKHGVPRVYTRAADLLADAGVEAVYVATPPHLHAAQTVAAAEAGKHVLCEKPMALDVEQAQRMVDACRAAEVGLMVCFYQRYNARHKHIARLLAEGAIGRLSAARIHFADYFPPRPGFWHHDPAVSGGGPLMDLGIHCVDLLRHLCGPVTAVTALTATVATDAATEDTATLLLEMAGGVQAVVTSHWSTANFAPERLNRLELYGTRGTILAAPIQAKDSAGTLELITAAGVQRHDVSSGGPRPHVALLQAFARALSRGEAMPISGEDGLASLAVVQAAYAASRSGRRVEVGG